MEHLDPAIIAQIKRLGGSLTAGTGRASEIKGFPIAPAMQEFFYDVHFPGEYTYCSAEESNCRVWLAQLNMGPTWLDEKEFVIANQDKRPLVIFGMTDGGNYLLLMDLYDSRPEDPMIYKIDHDDPGQKLYPQMRLSTFLGILYAETTARKLLLAALYLSPLDVSPEREDLYDEAWAMATLPGDRCAVHLARIVVHARRNEVNKALQEIEQMEILLNQGIYLSPEEHAAFQQSLARLKA